MRTVVIMQPELLLYDCHGLMNLPAGPVHPEETVNYLEDKVQALNSQRATATEEVSILPWAVAILSPSLMGYIPPHHCFCRPFFSGWLLKSQYCSQIHQDWLQESFFQTVTNMRWWNSESCEEEVKQ